MEPIAKLVRYFDGDGNPIIVQTVKPGKGWTRFGMRKRASFAFIRRLKRAGVTHVALAPAGSPWWIADFATAELLRTA